MKNVVDMDDWLRSQGVVPTDYETLGLLKKVEDEMDLMRECLRNLLKNMTADLEAARLELQRRDQAVALWQQRWNIELEKRIEAEKKLVKAKRMIEEK